MAKCYVADCKDDAKLTIAGTDIKFCPYHGAEYKAALTEMRSNLPSNNTNVGGHKNWRYVLDNVKFTTKQTANAVAGAPVNESLSGAPNVPGVK
jgi:hypothetical protein